MNIKGQPESGICAIFFFLKKQFQNFLSVYKTHFFRDFMEQSLNISQEDDQKNDKYLVIFTS